VRHVDRQRPRNHDRSSLLKVFSGQSNADLADTCEGLSVILRTWRGAVRPEDADRYLAHQADTGVAEYRATEGNLGAIVLRRPIGDLVEVITVSLWDSLEAVKRFAGDDHDRARFYPGDDELLAEKDLHVDHYEVVSWDLARALIDNAS